MPSSVAAGTVARIGSGELVTLETSQENRILLESFLTHAPKHVGRKCNVYEAFMGQA